MKIWKLGFWLHILAKNLNVSSYLISVAISVSEAAAQIVFVELKRILQISQNDTQNCIMDPIKHLWWMFFGKISDLLNTNNYFHKKLYHSQSAFTFLKLTIETLEQSVKYVQS